MLILTLRTDEPEAEIGLFEDRNRLSYEKWEAHRKLAETLHQKITELLAGSGYDWADIQAIVYYQGPGSFTGLRIGASLANALSSSLDARLVSASGENWIDQAIDKLVAGKSDTVAIPEYGQPVHITQQKK